MKRLVLGLTLLLTLIGFTFAQSDFTVLATVKLDKNESITLKNLKSRVDFVQKQYEPYGIKVNSVEQRKSILENLIYEKLLLQSAQKEGIVVTNSEVDSSFLNTFSQQLGMQLTESELSDIIKQQTGQSLDEYLKSNSGMNTSEYKAYLKNQLVVQKYVYSKKMNELRNITPSVEQIQQAYDMNKKNFTQNDMEKLFLVIVPFASSSEVDAKAKCESLRNQYSKDKKVGVILNNADNGKSYVAQERFVQQSQQQAQALGWSYEKLGELFSKPEGYISEVTKTESDYQFYVVEKKYEAKMLGLNDVVQPESNYTVYEYIKANLTQQLQSQFFENAALELSKSLDKPENVDRKKTGAELESLLNW